MRVGEVRHAYMTLHDVRKDLARFGKVRCGLERLGDVW